MSATRVTACHYCPGWAAGLWLIVSLLTFIFMAACRQHVPVMDRPAPPATDAITEPSSTIAPVAAPAPASRQRGPAYRIDNGLGSPIARLRQGYGEASSV